MDFVRVPLESSTKHQIIADCTFSLTEFPSTSASVEQGPTSSYPTYPSTHAVWYCTCGCILRLHDCMIKLLVRTSCCPACMRERAAVVCGCTAGRSTCPSSTSGPLALSRCPTSSAPRPLSRTGAFNSFREESGCGTFAAKQSAAFLTAAWQTATGSCTTLVAFRARWSRTLAQRPCIQIS